MRLVSILLLVVAVAAAGGAAFFLNNILSNNKEAEAPVAASGPSVLIAKKAMPAGTVVDASSVVWQIWPSDDVSEKYYVTENDSVPPPEVVVGSIVRHTISEGEPILPDKIFKRDQPGYLAGSIAPGMRAATIEVTAASGISGFIFPGDYVDVILTHDTAKNVIQNPEKKTMAEVGDTQPYYIRYVSEPILKNLKVLAIDERVADFDAKSKAVVVKRVTVEVTPRQAEMLATAKRMGNMTLSLRGLEKDDQKEEGPNALSFTTDVEVSPMLSNLDKLQAVMKTRGLLKDKKAEEAAPVAQPAPVAPVTAPRRQPSSTRVKIYRGPVADTQVFKGR